MVIILYCRIGNSTKLFLLLEMERNENVRNNLLVAIVMVIVMGTGRRSAERSKGTPKWRVNQVI